MELGWWSVAWRRAAVPAAVFAFVSLVLFSQACGDDGTLDLDEDDPGVEFVVGPAGATLESRDGNARLIIPAGALDAPTRITIRRIDRSEIPAPLLARRLISRVFRIGPDGLVFRRPVRVQLFFDDEELPAGIDLSDLTIGKVNIANLLEELTEIEILGSRVTGGISLHDRRGIGGLVSSLSPFAVWVDDPDDDKTAELEVTIATSGQELDPDGYALRLDGGVPQAVPLNGSAVLTALSPGQHALELTGVAGNCTVSGGATRTVTLTAGQRTPVLFNVTCSPSVVVPPTGTLEVETATSGTDLDVSGYLAIVDGAVVRALAANGVVSFTDVTAGSHVVQLSDVSANCSIVGENPRAVTVPAAGSARTRFEVTCVRARGALVVTVATSGDDPDPDGYVVALNPGPSAAVGPNDSFTFANLPDGAYRVTLNGVAANCTVGGRNPQLVAVPAGGSTTVEFDVQCVTAAPTPPPPPPDGTGALEGSVIAAITGQPVSGATVTAFCPESAQTPTATTTTDAQGAYRFEALPAGTCRIRVSGDGFAESERIVTIEAGETTQAGVTPALPAGTAEGQVTIVLNWGAAPRDLDAHLTGPLGGEGGGRFHVYFVDQGSCTASPFAELDLDDTNGFGPETMSICQQRPGVYRYSVHDFTNRSNASSTGLATSGAEVVLLRGSTEIGRFRPPEQVGTLWQVFELDGTTLTPLDRIIHQPNPDAVTSRTGAAARSSRRLDKREAFVPVR